MIYEVSVGGRTHTVEVRKDEARWFVAVDGGEEHEVEMFRPKPQLMSLVHQHRSYSVGLAALDDGWDVDLLGVHHTCQVVDPRRKALRLSAGAAEGTLSTSMPGKVVRLLIAEGDTVTKGTPVAVVEAMKMENELKAPIDGVVAEVMVQAGQAVDAGAVLLRIE